jgi:HlyD family secretion protein
MKWIPIAGLLVLALSAASVASWFLFRPDAAASYRTSEVRKEDLSQVVTATGSLEAVVSVEVGTQVSGKISEILVDFNDHVEAGQVVARIDPSLLEADVRSSQAGVTLASAQEKLARQALDRTTALHARQAATDQELESALAQSRVADAQRVAQDVGLERARRNLSYATIVSPTTGTVVSRAVEVGQTVNAGLSAPKLFEVAQDLAKMQILASVDEADIGLVKAGQSARFTVQAWGDRTFDGMVRQVRLEPAVADNVVTYTVVVDVNNEDGTLLPGMTATADIVVAEAPSALCVPAAALRFKPPAEVDTTIRGNKLWTPDGDGLRALPVEVGLVGDDCTQVTGPEVVEGLLVATGTSQVETKDAAGAAAASPFQKTSQGRDHPPGPPGAF